MNYGLTESGAELLKRIEENYSDLHFVCAEIGSGWQAVDDDKLIPVTRLEKARAVLQFNEIEGFGTLAKLECSLDNKIVDRGFYLSEMGIYACEERNYKQGEAVLFAYTVFPKELIPQYIPSRENPHNIVFNRVVPISRKVDPRDEEAFERYCMWLSLRESRRRIFCVNLNYASI